MKKIIILLFFITIFFGFAWNNNSWDNKRWSSGKWTGSQWGQGEDITYHNVVNTSAVDVKNSTGGQVYAVD